MKKIFPIIITLLLMFGFFVSSAPEPPYVFQVVVTSGSVPLDNIDVTIRNLDYKPDVKQTMITESSGRAIFSLSDYNTVSWFYSDRGDYGDRIEVKVCKEGTNDYCISSYEIGNECPKDISCMVKIDLKSVAVIISSGEEIPVEKWRERYVCWDGSKVLDKSDCPKGPEGDEGWSIWYTLILSLLGLAAIVFSYYKWGRGFSGLINYRINLAKKYKKEGKMKDAKKQLDIAIKMTKTALKRHKSGYYKKR